MKKYAGLLKSLRLAILVLVGLIIYAYGFQVTQVNLEKTREPRRQTQFVRILRALAQPDIVEYEQEETSVETPIWVACPPGGVEPGEPPADGPYLSVTPACADPDTEVMVEGFNFAPDSQGPINFIPPSGVTLQLGNYKADASGYFQTAVELPNRQPVDEAQHIRTITRVNVGMPRFTRTAIDTWNKIIETVFLALLATTIGTALAIPLSFLAASNIMKDITSPIASIALSIIAWPLGIFIGLTAGQWAQSFSEILTANTMLNVAGLLISPILIWGATRWALPQEEIHRPPANIRAARLITLTLTAMVTIIAMFLLADLAMTLGQRLVNPLGPLGFFANFLASLGDILRTIIIGVVALTVGAVFSNVAGRTGQFLTERLPVAPLKAANILLAAAAGAVLLALLGGLVDWLYEIRNPWQTYYLPAAVGAIIGAAIALRYRPKESLPIGLSVYYVVRTVLNTLRSIEAFILAIIFVVLLSTGPFAGVLALSLHTVASLAKLYSEQVESIMPGPLEAIKATGATRLQTIVYAVIPQIVPPYISFTMYRWDINVRMSTIIGFVGGGGIGFLLQQNINLLNYRAASVQMLAITIVVALMDYISSRMREKLV